WKAPPGPYGINTTTDGGGFFASLASSYVGQINLETGSSARLDPPTQGQGSRRVWPDSRGNPWGSEWNAGQVARYSPASGSWQEWKLPGARPQVYAVYVDESDTVWVTDWGSTSIVRFDPSSETFEPFTLPQGADVRQLLGRNGEVWGAESG